jgi:putative FmdB family regulatory protein
MPLYDRRCSSCDELFEVSCKIAEKEDPHECPHCGSIDGEWMLSISNAIPSDRLGRGRDGGFREVLSKIHHSMPGSTLKDRNTF